MAKFSFGKKYNKEKIFTIDTSEFEYYSLEDIYDKDDPDKVFVLRGVYINTKSMFEPAPVIATEDYYVNLPSHLLESCKEMINDYTAVKAINEGMAGFTVYEYYQKRFNRNCYSIRWCDIEPNNIDG